MFLMNIENLKKLNYHIFKKTLSRSIIYSKCGHKYYDSVKEYQKIYNHA